MEIILKETVDNLGQEGDVVTTKPGYARNYLIPKKIAVPANQANLTQLKQERTAIDARKERQNLEAETLTKKFTGTTVTIEQRVGEGDRLFGSVSSGDIAEKLAELGIKIDKKNILLKEPIKAIGETVIPIKTGFQMTAEITVQVVPLEEE